MASSALVTGAGGFIGANLARRLVREGHRVALVVRPGGESWRIDELRPHAEVVELDLRDEDAVPRLFGSARPELIFHLAAHGAYSWQTDPHRILATNLAATMNLLEAASRHGFQAFVNAGSSSEYGFRDRAPSESDLPEPNSHYAVAKAAASMYCAFVARDRGVHAVTLRLYSVYGPWEDPRRLIPRLLTLGRRGQLPPLANPETARDFVYVDDAVDAFCLAATPAAHGHTLFNVGSGAQTTLREIVAAVRNLLRIEAQPDWGSGEHRLWDTDVWVSDPRLIRDVLGWFPRRSLFEGLTLTADWLDEGSEFLERYTGFAG